MEIKKQNDITYKMLSNFLFLFKVLLKQASVFSSRLELRWMVPNLTVMTVAAIFKSRLLKKAAAKENPNIFVTNLRMQARFGMQSLQRYTLLMI